MKLKDFLQWGEQALALRRFALAEEIARFLLAQSPQNLAARTLMGHVSLASGNFALAEEHFAQALDMDPENPLTLTRYADALEAQEQEAETLAALRRAFECDPARMEVKQRMVALQSGGDGALAGEALLTRMGLARIHLRSGLIEHAIAELRQLLEGREAHWSAQVALMEAHWLNGDRQAAGGLADEILRAHPNCLKAILLSADVRAHLGLMDQARQFFERSRQVDPDFLLARALYPANGPSRLPLPGDDAELNVPLDFLQRIEAELAAKAEPEQEGATQAPPAPERTDSAERAAAARDAGAQEPAAAQPDSQRVIVTPPPSGEPETADPAPSPPDAGMESAEEAAAATASPARQDAEPGPAEAVDSGSTEDAGLATEPDFAEVAAADADVVTDAEAAPDADPEADRRVAAEAGGTPEAEGATWEALLHTLEQQAGRPDEAALDSIVERLEALADSAPDKLQAWQQLGDVYQRLGRTDRAMRAYMKALESSGKKDAGNG